MLNEHSKKIMMLRLYTVFEKEILLQGKAFWMAVLVQIGRASYVDIILHISKCSNDENKSVYICMYPTYVLTPEIKV